MARREQARGEAAFQHGDAGVDGLPTEPDITPEYRQRIAALVADVAAA